MYRLLIVDDEDHVVNYLVELFASTERIDLDIYSANSARAALRVLNETSIDIIVTDYRMPGMNGLELLDKITAGWVTRRVIFLSGYSEFEYIYQATAHGAVSYILKTEDDDVILNEVCAAAASIEKERGQLLAAEAARQEEALLRYIDACDSVNQLVHGEQPNGESGFDIRRPVLPAICALDQASKTITRSETLKLRLAIQVLTEKLIAPYVDILLHESETGVLYWIIQQKAQRTGPWSEKMPQVSYVTQLFEILQSACAENLAIRIGVYINNEVVAWKDLLRTAEAMAVKADTLGVLRSAGENAILFDPDAEPDEASAEQALVRRIQYFVISNLDGDLSLTNISEHVYYNPSYISRVYKSVAGSNLSTYIASRRIEKASGLLTTTEDPISEIAQACGFQSPQYFATVFKKHHGVAPQFFREQSRTGRSSL